jgi:Protein of unknown function (DUF2865)
MLVALAKSLLGKRLQWIRGSRDGALSALSPTHVACVLAGLMAVCVVSGPMRPVAYPPETAAVAVLPEVTLTAGAWIPAQDGWGGQLSSPEFWASRKSGGKPQALWGPSGLTKAQPNFTPPIRESVSPSVNNKRSSKPSRDDDDDDNGSGGGNTYRTMCVRLCDGSYRPVSFATTKDNFERDAASCARSCGGPTDAKLFTYRNPGGDVEDMEDLDGKPYKKLQTAFLFRTKYDATCKCRAHPWEDASVNRHKSYELAALAAKGNSNAQRELNDLKSKLAEEARLQSQEKLAQTKAKREAALAEKAAADAEAAAAKAAKRAASGKSGTKTAGLQQPAKEPAVEPRGEVRVNGQVVNPNSGTTAGQSRVGDATDQTAAPAGGKSGIVILRYGGRSPIEVTVPTTGANIGATTGPATGPRTSKAPISRREADAGPLSTTPLPQ